MTESTLPAAVIDIPHWRVNYRPATYDPELLPTLNDCLELVRSTKLSLRGWDFPHIGSKPGQLQTGNTWIASAVDFMTHIEYWRMYQSGQFLHLHAVREAVAPDWKAQLRAAAKSHAEWRTDVDWDGIPGYLSLLNVLYTLTEVFEFAARIAQRGVYSGEVTIEVQLRHIKGFVLTPDIDRAWSDIHASAEDSIGRLWHLDSGELVAGSRDASVAATEWFFERFNWLQPSTDVIRRDQAKFLSGQW